MGYIYCIVDQSARYKLGFAENVEQRLSDLQVGNAELLKIEYRLQVKDARRAETALHNIFAADHIRGEWFKIQNLQLLRKIFRIEETNEREIRLLESMGLK